MYDLDMDFLCLLAFVLEYPHALDIISIVAGGAKPLEEIMDPLKLLTPEPLHVLTDMGLVKREISADGITVSLTERGVKLMKALLKANDEFKGEEKITETGETGCC
jgi:CTP-dependent riboflavin kinase